MPAFLGTAIISISLALVFYSIGTWAERIQRTLKLWHIIFFLFGLCADTLGTALMSQIASANVGVAAAHQLAVRFNAYAAAQAVHN